MPRVQLNIKPTPAPAPITGVNFVTSGCTLLDCVLGGGWAEGRVANIVGDKSAGKTLLAIEQCANFSRIYSAENIRYAESEAAFDLPFARTMGMPEGVSMSKTGEIRTVENFYDDIRKHMTAGSSTAKHYILDSLDALSDEAEAERDFGTATYGTGKAKDMSEMFRRITADTSKHNCSLTVISQIRDKIGVTFGETKTRSGGHALDFYCSQIIWLSEIKKITREVTGVKRVVGVEVLARNKKNKVGKPFRQAEFSLLFNYGIDDEASMIDWLKKNKGEDLLPEPLANYTKLLNAARNQRDRLAVGQISADLRHATLARWDEIETALEPPMSKYGD